MSSNHRPFAVVTGASSGIGREIATQLVERGYDVLAVAENTEVGALTSSSVETAQVDLRTYEGVEELVTMIEKTGRPVDVAAINAGVGVSGAFATETPLDAELDLIALNVTSTVHLTKRLVTDMVARDSGRILITSSIAATMPGPFDTVYSASKAFGYSFALGLRGELSEAGSNVTVTALMPGPTDTNFFERADMADTKLGTSKKDDPADVARDGLDALFDGKDHVIAGSFKNKAQATLAEVFPDRLTARMHGKQAAPGSGDWLLPRFGVTPEQYVCFRAVINR